MSLFTFDFTCYWSYGTSRLGERAEILIGKINAATTGRIFMIYLFVRQVTVALVLTCPVWLPWFVR